MIYIARQGLKQYFQSALFQLVKRIVQQPDVYAIKFYTRGKNRKKHHDFVV